MRNEAHVAMACFNHCKNYAVVVLMVPESLKLCSKYVGSGLYYFMIFFSSLICMREKAFFTYTLRLAHKKEESTIKQSTTRAKKKWLATKEQWQQTKREGNKVGLCPGEIIFYCRAHELGISTDKITITMRIMKKRRDARKKVVNFIFSQEFGNNQTNERKSVQLPKQNFQSKKLSGKVPLCWVRPKTSEHLLLLSFFVHASSYQPFFSFNAQ